MMLESVESLRVDPAARSEVCRVLSTVGAQDRQCLYALMVAGDKLVALVQPKNQAHQLAASDLILITNFVATQTALKSGATWTPLCLPRFNDRGFLHAYVAYVDGDSGICLALLAGDNAPETFETFRGARRAIESALRRDGVLAAAARAAAQPADARLADLLPADCLHLSLIHI